MVDMFDPVRSQQHAAAVPVGRSLAQERHARIVDEVRVRGSMRVTELAALLDVSDMTIRRDLDVLDDAGALVKVHGGAKVSTEHAADEPGFDAKSGQNTAEKEAIARAAAALVEGGATIGLIAGTTTWRLAGELAMVPNLTVVTNSMRVAEVFNESKRPDRSLILTGGVRTPSDALVGPIAAAALGALHVDTLFIGVHGMTEQAGFTTPNLLESDTNRAFIRAAGRKIVLADHTKWGVTGLSSFAELSDVDMLITDDHLPDVAAELLASRIPDVRQVSGSDVSPGA
jgi:DeoR/GlpR family transcriptional regulator of sugar metabolism